MKKKQLLLGALAGGLLALCGCSSVQVAKAEDLNGMKLTTTGSTVAHVAASNCGLYLLWIPLITGDSEAAGGVSFLGDDPVSAPAVTGLVTREAKSLGASRTTDLVSLNSSAGFIFYWKNTWVSGNAIK